MKRGVMFIKNYSHFHCIIAFPIDPSSDSQSIDRAGAKIWSAAFRLDRDVSELFPYINAELDDALVYENPRHVRFLFEGYRCFLYPDTVAIHFFESREAAEAFIPGFINFLNDIYNRKAEIRPNHDRIRQIPVTEILKILPKTNCRECGYLSCMAFAAAMSRGRATAGECPGLASPAREIAQFPVLDSNKEMVDAVDLPISTAGMKNRIKVLQERISELEAGMQSPGHDHNVSSGLKKSEIIDFKLTEREIEILGLIAQGKTNIEISGHLFISHHTVKSHMINIFNKMGINDRTRAAVIATQHGII